MPMRPPARILPAVTALNFAGTVTTASWKPAFVQVTVRSFLVLWTETLPGVVTYHTPSEFLSSHIAPEVGAEVIEIDCVVPLMIVAQPESARPRASNANAEKIFMRAPR